MALRDIFRRKETRASIEDPTVPISSDNLLAFLGLDTGALEGEPVTVSSALGVPAVWAAVNFLAGTMASLPVNVYTHDTKGGQKRDTSSSLRGILHDVANPEMSSFDWRKYLFEQVLTGGRAVTYIERSAAGKVVNLWPLEPDRVSVIRRDGRKIYRYRNSGGRATIYEAAEVIDVAFMLRPDQVDHRGPIHTNRQVIAIAQALTKYGGRFFANGGVPPFFMEGPIQTPAGLQRATDDLDRAVAKAAKESRMALALPAGHTLKPMGIDPVKAQMVEANRFVIEQIARIYQLPPVFLQDLTHGTFANTEQQDLHFTKHTLHRWVVQFEQELNLKLTRRGGNKSIKLSVDAILRGDYATRMTGYAQGIQHGVLKPNEARRFENLPDDDAGDVLLAQGAMVPLLGLGQAPPPAPPPIPADTQDEGAEDE